jgi:uncharacterized membrane protein YfcA
MIWMLYLGIGLAAGVLAGMFGIGGGILIVPALVYVAGMDQQTAQGTSLGALLLPVGALGALAYYKRGHMNMPAAAWLALGLFVAIAAGALAVFASFTQTELLLTSSAVAKSV